MKFVIVVLFIGFLFPGCGKKRPNLKHLVKEEQIGRLDRDVFTLDTITPDVVRLHQKYGRYFDIYTQGVLNLGVLADSGFNTLFGLFIKDPVMREIADTIAEIYPDLHKQEEELSQALGYYRYYFPDKAVPKVYTHVSGFNQSVIVDSATIGISLDNYLGEGCAFYSMLAVPVPMYARKKMTGDDMIRDALSGWLSSEFPFRPGKNDLVSGMIYQGKIAYLLQMLFPGKENNWLLGFTPDQEEWCCNNEGQVWKFLIENDYLFSTQQRLIMKYLNDAPYTSGMPVESPGKTVVWVGFQIVKKYMEKTGNDLGELMNEQDYHKILRVAGYRP